VDSVEAVSRVARRLGSLSDQVVFLGGSSVPLLVTDTGAAPARTTNDVDVVIEVATLAAYSTTLRDDLLARGFAEDDSADAPRCRWIVEGLKVDIMPADGSVLGMPSRWFRTALAGRQLLTLPDGVAIWVVSAPDFLATKLEAFGDRGGSDYRASQDLEDVIAVLDGRASIEAEFARANVAVRDYIVAEMRRLLKVQAFIDAVPGYLPGDPASQARVPALMARIGRIAA
jgi:predicted nucleotidyltransferase